MSRFPNKEEITKLRVALRTFKSVRVRLIAARQAAALLPELEKELSKSQSEVAELMEFMDVKYAGNAGWENRIMMFLAEFDDQAGKDP